MRSFRCDTTPGPSLSIECPYCRDFSTDNNYNLTKHCNNYHRAAFLANLSEGDRRHQWPTPDILRCGECDLYICRGQMWEHHQTTLHRRNALRGFTEYDEPNPTEDVCDEELHGSGEGGDANAGGEEDDLHESSFQFDDIEGEDGHGVGGGVGVGAGVNLGTDLDVDLDSDHELDFGGGGSGGGGGGGPDVGLGLGVGIGPRVAAVGTSLDPYDWFRSDRLSFDSHEWVGEVLLTAAACMDRNRVIDLERNLDWTMYNRLRIVEVITDHDGVEVIIVYFQYLRLFI